MANQKIESSSTHIKSPNVDAALRMFANCTQEVNEARAQFRGNLAISKKRKTIDLGLRKQNLSIIPAITEKSKKRKKFGEASNDILVNVFVELTDRKAKKIKGEVERRGNLVSAQLP